MKHHAAKRVTDWRSAGRGCAKNAEAPVDHANYHRHPLPPRQAWLETDPQKRGAYHRDWAEVFTAHPLTATSTPTTQPRTTP